MPSFVITASVYVDEVNTPEEATQKVEKLNDAVTESGDADIQIVLPYPITSPITSTSAGWEETGDSNNPDDDGGEAAYFEAGPDTGK